MAAGKYDINIEQGATYNESFTWRVDDGSTPPTGPIVDLTGCTARMQIRQTQSTATYFIELTTENGRITLYPGAADPNIELNISATDTALLTFTTAAVYDLEIVTAAGYVTRVLKGAVTLDKEVTR